MSVDSVVLNGLLKPDGIIQLDYPPHLPAGRVRVRLEPVLDGARHSERLPDRPWADSALPAPVDLPQPEPVAVLQPRMVRERLPEPFGWEGGDV